MTIQIWLRKVFGSNSYFLLLVIFFVLHQWNSSFGIISSLTITKSLLLIISGSAAFFLIWLALCKNQDKAALLTFLFFFFGLFYFVVKSMAISLSEIGIIIGPRILLGCLFLCSFIIFFIPISFFKKLKRFLFVALLVLCVFEILSIGYKAIMHKQPKVDVIVKKEDVRGRKLPSVYFVILDEYTGSEMLKKHFNYDNQGFLTELSLLEFNTVRKAVSNYNYTLLSISSLLNCEYLIPEKNMSVYDNNMYYPALRKIENNKVFKTFHELGYKSYNYSPFKIGEESPKLDVTYLPQEFSMLFHNTAFFEFVELLPFSIARRMGDKKRLEKLFNKNIASTKSIMNKVLSQSKLVQADPSFSYIHLMMPHAPFAVDSSGVFNADFLSSRNFDYEKMKDAYLQYLVYTNKVITQFLSQLKANTNGRAVIILASDHGIRGLSQSKDFFVKFNTLNSVYCPDGQPVGFYDGMSNVNIFRVLFNAISGQQKIPLLKDSMVIR